MKVLQIILYFSPTKVEIGKKEIVGAGAVVTKNVSQNSVVDGVPDHLIKDISDTEVQGVKL